MLGKGVVGVRVSGLPYRGGGWTLTLGRGGDGYDGTSEQQ